MVLLITYIYIIMVVTVSHVYNYSSHWFQSDMYLGETVNGIWKEIWLIENEN